MMTARLLIPIACLAALAAGCEGTGIEKTEARRDVVTATKSDDLEMLAVRPAYVRAALGAHQDFVLRAWTESGDDQGEDVTAEAWTSDDPGVVALEGDGRVRAVGVGETLIRARYLGEEAVARIVVSTVADTALQPPEVPPEDEGNEGNEPNDETPPGHEPPHESPEDTACGGTPPSSEAPFADRVVSHVTGSGGGFHEDLLPDVVLGPPKGGGRFLGSLDVFSLGVGGEIVLEFADYVATDCEGPDFIVFENAFQVGTSEDMTFAEPGVVSVSEDGETWVDFPCNLAAAPYSGCAGVHPTLANPDVNEIDPTDPATAGGDAFDLADVGLKKARFVKIQDSGLGLGPIGPGTRGFDLDGVAIVNGTTP